MDASREAAGETGHATSGQDTNLEGGEGFVDRGGQGDPREILAYSAFQHRPNAESSVQGGRVWQPVPLCRNLPDIRSQVLGQLLHHRIRNLATHLHDRAPVLDTHINMQTKCKVILLTTKFIYCTGM